MPPPLRDAAARLPYARLSAPARTVGAKRGRETWARSVGGRDQARVKQVQTGANAAHKQRYAHARIQGRTRASLSRALSLPPSLPPSFRPSLRPSLLPSLALALALSLSRSLARSFHPFHPSASAALTPPHPSPRRGPTAPTFARTCGPTTSSTTRSRRQVLRERLQRRGLLAVVTTCSATRWGREGDGERKRRRGDMGGQPGGQGDTDYVLYVSIYEP